MRSFEKLGGGDTDYIEISSLRQYRTSYGIQHVLPPSTTWFSHIATKQATI